MSAFRSVPSSLFFVLPLCFASAACVAQPANDEPSSAELADEVATAASADDGIETKCFGGYGLGGWGLGGYGLGAYGLGGWGLGGCGIGGLDEIVHGFGWGGCNGIFAGVPAFGCGFGPGLW